MWRPPRASVFSRGAGIRSFRDSWRSMAVCLEWSRPASGFWKTGCWLLGLVILLVPGLPGSAAPAGAQESGSWTQLAPAGSLPEARQDHAAAWDLLRQRMLVFGGQAPGFLNDTWELSLAGGGAWAPVVASGPLPEPRSSHTANYDLLRDRLLVYGGQINGGLPQRDLWALGLGGSPAWSLLQVAGNAPRRMWHTGVLDPVRDRLMVFGGWDESYAYQNDVWALSLSGTPTWSVLSASGTPPSPRLVHAAVYDPVRDRMLVFGGYDAVGQRNDVWALTLGAAPAWTQLTPAGGPPSPRSRHRLVYDPPRDRLVVFGGFDGSLRNDVWALSLAGPPAWTQLAPDGSIPPVRHLHGAVYDSLNGRMVVFGGGGSSGPLDDTWVLAWSTPAGIPPLRAPGEVALGLPRPNPGRDAVVFEFKLPAETWAELRVYDPAGREVRTLVAGTLPAGTHAAHWDATSTRGERVRPGVYLARLRAGAAQVTRRLVILE